MRSSSPTTASSRSVFVVMHATLGKFACLVKADMPRRLEHTARVKTDAARVLSENLFALMAVNATLDTQAKVAKAAGMDQRTVGRILKQEHSPTLRQIDKLAEAFHLLPWQFLVPGLDAKNPPAVTLTTNERSLYDRLTTAAEGIASYRR